MAPIEVFFGAIVFIFSLIGLVRGFLRELGVTTVMMFLLFFLSRFEPQLNNGLVRAMGLGGPALGVDNKELLGCWVFMLIVIGAAFISYQGETLAYGGEAPRGSQGALLGIVTGLLNGYLIAGSIWFYMDRFGYPIEWMGFKADRLSELARRLIEYLPLNFLGRPVLFGQSLLLYLSGMLILFRVLK